jgi:hypothetical protein
MYTTETRGTLAERSLCILKAISWWAAMHKHRARVLILLLYIPFIGLALALNEELLTLGVHLPVWTGFIMLAVAILSYTVYPRRRLHSGKDRYMLRKLSQMVLSAATFCSIVWMYNANVLSGERWATPAYGSMRYTIEKPRQEQQTNAVVLSSSHAGKSLVQRLNSLRQWYRDQETWVKVLLTVLTCVLATAVFLLLAVVSCLIVCEGFGFLGVALFVLGTVGIVIGTIAIIRNIWDMGPRRRRHR